MPSNSSKRSNATGKLDLDERRTLVIPALGTFDRHFNPETVSYHPVPFNHAAIEDAPVWRVLLKFGKRPQRVIVGLDIYTDIVFGRGAFEPESPHIDLTNLSALECGVSRIHALLRPTPNNLYLIDLKSTNGSFINAIRLKQEAASAIRNRDEIAFATLMCVVEIVSPPPHPIVLPAPEVSQAKVEDLPRFDKPRIGTETISGVKLIFPPDTDDPELPQ